MNVNYLCLCFLIVTGCPLCLSGVRENVPVSLSRCEKVFLI